MKSSRLCANVYVWFFFTVDSKNNFQPRFLLMTRFRRTNIQWAAMVCLTVSLFEIIISCVKLLIPAARCLVYPRLVQEKKSVPNVQVGNVYMPYFRLVKLAPLSNHGQQSRRGAIKAKTQCLLSFLEPRILVISINIV